MELFKLITPFAGGGRCRRCRARSAALLRARHPLRDEHVIQAHQLRIWRLLLLCIAEGQDYTYNNKYIYVLKIIIVFPKITQGK